MVRGPISDSTYWDQPDRTAGAFFPGGWFRPLDLGYIDADGFLYYVDRAKDRIHTADGVVYPHLVEEAVLRHPHIANCGVVGISGSDADEVVAAVQLKPGRTHRPQLVDEIDAAARAGLRPHERPRRIVIVPELPTVLGGAKVRRDVLREQLEEATS